MQGCKRYRHCVVAVSYTHLDVYKRQAEGEGNSSEGNEDKNITVTPEAGACDQAEAAAKDADKAVEDAEKSAADVKAEVVDKVAAGDVKDAEGKDLVRLLPPDRIRCV